MAKAKMIDGRILAEEILKDLVKKVTKLKRRPGLGAVLVGDDPASHNYVNAKKKACLKIGMNFYDYLCGGKDHPTDTQQDIIKVVQYLNNDPNVDGIIVQLPMPQNFDAHKIIAAIDPKKDVDGFLPQNQQDYLIGSRVITPPLIRAVNAAIESTGVDLKGKKAVVISKNPIFSDPMKEELESQGLVDVKTIKPEGDFTEVTKQADLLITIIGQPHIIKKEMVKPGAIIIDIGTTLNNENKWSGDVDPTVDSVAAWRTPVPGGIGPLTVAMLLKNTYEIAEKNQ